MQKKFSICPLDHRWAKKNFEMQGALIMKNNLNRLDRERLSQTGLKIVHGIYYIPAMGI